MADESLFEVSLTPTIYYFVDRDTDEVAGIHMYSIFGMGKMDPEIQDWRPTSREDEDFINLYTGNYDMYKYEWDSEEYEMVDPEDVTDWYPTTAKAFGRGETVTAEDLAPYAKKINSELLPATDEDVSEEQ